MKAFVVSPASHKLILLANKLHRITCYVNIRVNSSSSVSVLQTRFVDIRLIKTDTETDLSNILSVIRPETLRRMLFCYVYYSPELSLVYTWTGCWRGEVESRLTASTSPDYRPLAGQLRTLLKQTNKRHYDMCRNLHTLPLVLQVTEMIKYNEHI